MFYFLTNFFSTKRVPLFYRILSRNVCVVTRSKDENFLRVTQHKRTLLNDVISRRFCCFSSAVRWFRHWSSSVANNEKIHCDTNTSAIYSHPVYTCSVWLLQQIPTISRNSINRLVFIMQCDLCSLWGRNRICVYYLDDACTHFSKIKMTLHISRRQKGAWKKLHVEGPKILGAAVGKLVATATRRPGFVPPLILMYCQDQKGLATLLLLIVPKRHTDAVFQSLKDREWKVLEKLIVFQHVKFFAYGIAVCIRPVVVTEYILSQINWVYIPFL
jgi:hypothetical protein